MRISVTASRTRPRAPTAAQQARNCRCKAVEGRTAFSATCRRKRLREPNSQSASPVAPSRYAANTSAVTSTGEALSCGETPSQAFCAVPPCAPPVGTPALYGSADVSNTGCRATPVSASCSAEAVKAAFGKSAGRCTGLSAVTGTSRRSTSSSQSAYWTRGEMRRFSAKRSSRIRPNSTDAYREVSTSRVRIAFILRRPPFRSGFPAVPAAPCGPRRRDRPRAPCWPRAA